MSDGKTLARGLREVLRLPSEPERTQLAAIHQGEASGMHVPWERVRNADAFRKLTASEGVGFADGALGIEFFLESEHDLNV